MGSIVVSVDSLRSLGFASISGTYTAVGIPFAHPMRVIKIVNGCDTDMIISFDAVNDNDIIPASSFALYDISANEAGTDGWFFRTGTQVYVKQVSAPASGTVYVTTMYGQGE